MARPRLHSMQRGKNYMYILACRENGEIVITLSNDYCRHVSADVVSLV